MAAIISGSTLSMLFYDHSSSLGNKEGLLTGKVISHVKDTISDSQINNVRVETKIYIYGCTCQSRFESFHDNKGNLNHIDKSTIGWYRYRHNTSHRMSMKEKSIHQTLLKNIPPDKQENFIFILCTSQKSENVSTSNFDFTVFKYSIRDKKYAAVPVTVINLGDTTHTDYKCAKSCTIDYDSGALGDLLSTFEHELIGTGDRTSEAAGVQKMAESIQTQLQCLTYGVMESDQEALELQSELEKMELQLHQKIEKKRAMKPLPPSPTSPEMPSTSRLVNEDTAARSKREQKRKDQMKLYPNLSDLKVSSGGSRQRRMSDDNYSIDENNGKSSNLHTQIEQKCHILDSPIEVTEETLSNCSTEFNLSGEKLAEPVPNHVDDKHIDIPFADSEGFDHSHSIKDETSAKNKNDAKDVKNRNSDPFSFVEGMLANSKSGVLQKKMNQDKTETKNTKPQSGESGRVTRSRNSQAIGNNSAVNQSEKQSSGKQNQNKQVQQRSRSGEKQTTNVSNKRKNDQNRNNDQSGNGSEEDIFDTKDENGENHVIDVSSSPVF
ncbi:ABRO1 [Mytilus edulis]|uniref:FAM175B n=1 Tax=Mytilus edulis TaxID=6550 RepID=A0A8S3TAZ6_MYTED|nr:ABRO1 [Mytilus edulis]